MPISGAVEEEDGAAKVLSHSSYIAYRSYRESFSGRTYSGDFLHVLGEVQNVITKNIKVKIIPHFYDENGAVIEAEPIHTSVEPLEILTPDQKSPFEEIILDEETSKRVAHYEFSFEYSVTTEEPSRVEITDHSSYVSGGRFNVVGEVKNVETRNLRVRYILATFYDEQGTVIGAQKVYDDIEILVPGQKSPFDTRSREGITDSIESYGLCAECMIATNVAPYRNLQIVAHNSTSSLSYYTVTGEVKNVGERDATFVKVLATFYDSDCRIVAYDYGYTDPSDLETDQTGSFRVYLFNEELSKNVVSYDLQVQCTEYVEITIEESYIEEITIGEAITISGDITVEFSPLQALVTLQYSVDNGVTWLDFMTLTSASDGSYSYSWTPTDTGSYQVRALWDGDNDFEGVVSQATSLTVKPTPLLSPANIILSNLEITPSEAKPGQEVRITVDTENIGEASGTKTVTLTINGVVESTKDVTLSSGETDSVTFSVTKQEDGVYRVNVHGLADKFIVTSMPPLEIDTLLIVTAIIVGCIVIAVALYLSFRRTKSRTVVEAT